MMWKQIECRERELIKCQSNILKFYHDRCLTQSIRLWRSSPNWFSLFMHVTSSIIETYFSKSKFITDLHMTDMRDRLSSVTFHLLQQLRKYVDDECVELVSNLRIDAETALPANF